MEVLFKCFFAGFALSIITIYISIAAANIFVFIPTARVARSFRKGTLYMSVSKMKP